MPPKVQPLAKRGQAAGADDPFPPTGASGPAEQLTWPGAGTFEARPRVEPLSAERYRVEFTASAAFHRKLEHAQQLLSHSVPSGDLAALFERALDELIAKELKRRTGAGKPRKRRELQPAARHIPVEVARQVWERDAGQCLMIGHKVRLEGASLARGSEKPRMEGR